ncbi:MAG: hypothetical protein H0W68_08945, partial [Gemmatimonadaceae bacterium]|nr:hypothetical protein [Gemmatimonadaceae bacterium]
MSAFERLESLRRAIVATVAARSLAWSGSVVAVTGVIQHVTETGAPWIPWALGAAALAATALRHRHGITLPDVALWVEQEQPLLRYALVTVAEHPRAGALPAVEAQLLAVTWERPARLRLARALGVPMLTLGVALALALWLPRTGVAGTTVSARATSASPRSTGTVDPLRRLRVRVTVPAYAGGTTRTLDDPTSVDALTGSRVTVTGVGAGAAVTLRVDSSASHPVTLGDEWSAALTMPSRASLLRFTALGSRDRLIVLAPVVDAVPVVTLLLPARDTILRVARGVIVLRAGLRDDIGLRDAYFELVVSSGSGENFTFRSAVIARVSLGGLREKVAQARLSLDSLALKPGDVVQLRAVGRDGNTVSGPGIGGSETRAMRVARAGEDDT